MLVRFHMHENFDLLRAVERLLLRGKLDEAQDLAREMSVAVDESAMAAWSTQLIEEACGIEAKLVSACGSCHVAAGVTPDFAPPPAAPPDRSTLEARMARHLWAADRLWEGMVGGADDSWRAGLDVLAATPLPAAQLGPGRKDLARQLQRLADC